MNISDMLYSLYLFEGFKDDVLSAYQKKGINVKSNKDFINAVSLFNSNSKIKDDIKKQLGSISNIGYGVADRFSPTEFINLVNNANQKYAQQNQKGLQKSLARQTASSVSNDYYLYPCRTFEEAHRAAFSHTGNLKKLSREERVKFFKEQYGIIIPKPRTHYETDMSPAEMLEFMKKCPVFMEPTWCVCADETFWERYKLDSTKDEDAKCFIVISKTHPNVRFCVTAYEYYGDSTDEYINSNFIEDDYIVQPSTHLGLGEFRDIWQIGGVDVRQVGMKMAKLAFGDISGIFKNVLKKYERTLIDEIDDGNGLFRKNESLTSFNKKLLSLIDGKDMFFDCSNLTSFTSELPKLTDANRMFLDCSNLTSFTSELPSLTDANRMFEGCSKLSSFDNKLPKLTKGTCMFEGCSKLSSFDNKLPKLTNGSWMFQGCYKLASFTSELPSLTDASRMFAWCSNLTSFTVELPSLADGNGMFCGCNNLSSFTSKLPNLKDGSNMFSGCKLDKPSVLRILTSIPKVNNGSIDIGVGYSYTEDKDTLQAFQIAKEKGWTVVFRL